MDDDQEPGAAAGLANDVRSIRILSEQESVVDDIYDFVDENPIASVRENVDDIDKAISKIGDLRSTYRSLHKELKRLSPDTYEGDHSIRFDNVLKIVKDYIKDAKDARVNVRSSETDKNNDDMLRKRQTVKLMIDNGSRVVTELGKQFTQNFENMSEQEYVD